MHIHVVYLFLVLFFSACAAYVNNQFNTLRPLRIIFNVVIAIVAVYMTLTSLGLLEGPGMTVNWH